MKQPQVIAIVGPTAAGKTSLSVALAQKFSGEVVSADSRQIYKGLDLGTGKVTEREMRGVRHHLLDIVSPSETYTATDFLRDGSKAVAAILKRNYLPIIAGGTLFYVDVLLGRVTPAEVPPNKALRKALEEYDTETLFEMLKEQDSQYAASIDKDNPRRLIRALEIIDLPGEIPKPKKQVRYHYLILGIKVGKDTLQKSIHVRLKKRLGAGMLKEVEGLLEQGLSHKRLETLGIEYKYLSRHLRGQIDLNTAKKEIETKSWQYAKRQLTWLRRDKEVRWVTSGDVKEAEKMVTEFLE